MVLPVKSLLSGNDWKIFIDGSDKIFGSDDRMIPASVPGNIQSDLQDACLLKPLRYGMGDEKLHEVCLKRWVYVKEFCLDDEIAQERNILVFDGIDYSGEVFVNGKSAGRAEGQFNRHHFDISDLVRNGSNKLEVRIDPMPEELFDWLILSDGKQSGEGTPYHFVKANDAIRTVLKGLKTPATCSYDWGTNIFALGIWKDVKLITCRNSFIKWAGFFPEVSEDLKSAAVRIEIETDSIIGYDAIVKTTLTNKDDKVSHEQCIKVESGADKLSYEFIVENPELWWPNGYGDQPLFDVCISMYDDNDLIAEHHDRIGFRRITWDLTEGSPENFDGKFALNINNVRVRTLGSCITTPDLLSGRIGDRGTHFIKMAKECNMTALRQHGGQVIFPKSMYDACDELGIMLLVDFPMGNCVPENEPEFLDNLSSTISNIVKQIRNHVSIIEWSGGNELNVFFDKNADLTGLNVVREAAESADPSRVFRDTCPISGSRHAPWDYIPELHYDFYNSDIKDNFGKIPMMRYGEFGCQTPSNLMTWYRDIPELSRTLLDPEDPILIRKNIFYGVFSPEYWLLTRIIENVFGKLDDIEDIISGGQYLAAEGMRYAMDALRAMGRRLGGFTSWDYNEPWPNGAGSFLVDYDGRPVMMYYYAKQALEPVSIQMKYDSLYYDFFNETFAEIRLVSDFPRKMTGLRWSCICRDRLGRVYATENGHAEIDHLDVLTLGRIKLNPPENMNYGPVLVELELKDSSGNIISERLYVFGAKGLQAPLRSIIHPEDTTTYEWGVPYALTGIAGGRISTSQLEAETAGYKLKGNTEYLDLLITNKSAMTAFPVTIEPLLQYKTDIFISNNYFHIPPGQSRQITIKSSTGSELSLVDVGWSIKAANSEEVVVRPGDKVIAYMGRADGINAEFKGNSLKYSLGKGVKEINAKEMNYLVNREFEFEFNLEKTEDCSLILGFSDRCKSGCSLDIKVNVEILSAKIPGGLGIQDSDREQLSYEYRHRVSISKQQLREGNNKITIYPREGWFTWDNMVLSKDF